MSKLLVLLSILTAFTPDLIAQPGVSTTLGWSDEVNYFKASSSPWRDELASTTPAKASNWCSCENCDRLPTDGSPCECDRCGVGKPETKLPATTIIVDGKTYSKQVHSDGSMTYTPIRNSESVVASRGRVYSAADGYTVPLLQLAPVSRCYIDAYGRRVCP